MIVKKKFLNGEGILQKFWSTTVLIHFYRMWYKKTTFRVPWISFMLIIPFCVIFPFTYQTFNIVFRQKISPYKLIGLHTLRHCLRQNSHKNYKKLNGHLFFREKRPFNMLKISQNAPMKISSERYWSSRHLPSPLVFSAGF